MSPAGSASSFANADPNYYVGHDMTSGNDIFGGLRMNPVPNTPVAGEQAATGMPTSSYAPQSFTTYNLGAAQQTAMGMPMNYNANSAPTVNNFMVPQQGTTGLSPGYNTNPGFGGFNPSSDQQGSMAMSMAYNANQNRAAFNFTAPQQRSMEFPRNYVNTAAANSNVAQQSAMAIPTSEGFNPNLATFPYPVTQQGAIATPMNSNMSQDSAAFDFTMSGPNSMEELPIGTANQIPDQLSGTRRKPNQPVWFPPSPMRIVESTTAGEVAKYYSKGAIVDFQSKELKTMAAKPALRWPESTTFTNMPNWSRSANVRSLLIQIYGPEARTKCTACQIGQGRWKLCVAAPEERMKVCASCSFNSNGARCSHHVKNRARLAEEASSSSQKPSTTADTTELEQQLAAVRDSSDHAGVRNRADEWIRRLQSASEMHRSAVTDIERFLRSFNRRRGSRNTK